MRKILYFFYWVLEVFSSHKYRYYIGIEKFAGENGKFHYSSIYINRAKTFAFANVLVEDAVIYLRKAYPTTKFKVFVTEFDDVAERKFFRVT